MFLRVRLSDRGRASDEGATMRSDTTMRGARMKRESSAGHSGAAPRQRMITVIALDDGFSGALAYALQSALHDPAKIRAVRVGQPRERHLDLHMPLPVSTMTAQDADIVVRSCAERDVIVVEVPAHLEDAAASLVIDLRRHASCLLVEVDDAGRLVRASGPGGWSYSDLGGAATATGLDSGFRER
jgi:hypothetical protein